LVQIDKENLIREMVQQFLNAHELVMKEIRRSTGETPEPYKDLEINVLEQLFGEIFHETENGLDYIAKMLSGLIIKQALSNTNHRTSIYFIASLLKQHGLHIDMIGNEIIIREYFHDSKHILRKARSNYQEKHLQTSRQFLIDVLGADQSGKLGNMEAKSFIVSFNASSKDNIGF